ncbi:MULTISPECIES: TetR/AcrR family transcriptional regulator [Nocardia]|uniref:TetR/AcrR family transcriptional regulator n=1 Tax=Nocardia TaxID=1817 RepID=UPI0018948E71|nr:MULTISPECIES: TetR family transcriptional regulator [Nocardia]MBF6184657.1 TetR family transcriptional regulator [Nocardia farcinica]MBF6246837.1 TetR family transcriptional regulator [Nocardia elegans]MBF6310501.1 TetR family transcriptional regulator [Nocardia farcinica]MBF6405680.1 TetR family transcriptional regulator [Nocardia farcinica]UEX24899.1 TetR family transcriptional regulator [Nocardia farcinica]
MPRASRAQAESHRQQVVAAASAQVRAQGAERLTVTDVMAAAGLTHGGFYRHFRNKDDLVAQACAAACAEKVAEMREMLATTTDPATARRDYLRHYLSDRHRDHPDHGCGIAALVTDVVRAPHDSPLRRTYLDGLRNMIDGLAEFGDRPDDPDDRERDVLAELALMVGALVLARATADDDLSDRFLTAARDRLGGE